MVESGEVWKRCSSCKKPLSYGAQYYVCSVSTCTRKRTGFAFCSVDCWETHLPLMRHREAWAVEEVAPTKEAWARELAAEAGEGGGSSRSAGTGTAAPSSAAAPTSSSAPAVVRRSGGGEPDRGRRIAVPSAPAEPPPPREVLVIASRLKEYIRQRYGMNTSDGVLEPLSDQLRKLCDRAVLAARDEGRKTVLDRDLAFLDDER